MNRSIPDSPSHSRIDEALADYAEWRNQPPADYWSGGSIFGTIRDYGNTRIGNGHAPHMEVIGGDGVMCKPDGGMSNFVEQHERSMRLERVSRSIHDALPFLPPLLKPVFEATYVGPPREVPRSEREAAQRLEISLSKYQKLKFGLLCWFGGVHFKTEAAQADDDSTNDEGEEV